MERTFSIVTTSKSRLDHLKTSLPKMLEQADAEVIVVDYSCPQGTGDYVTKHFPAVRVVSVSGEQHFSNWKARNAGAAVASADVLIFCDADTVLADDAVAWISANLPANAYGFFKRTTSRQFNRAGARLAANQLKGFHVIPAAAFRRVGGYDEVLEGYASGADTDLEERLGLMGVGRQSLDPCIISSVVEHDDACRTEHHADPIRTSYCAGLLYRAAKLPLLRMRRQLELTLETRHELYQAAKTAARALAPGQNKVSLDVALDLRPVLMPRQLGYEKGNQRISLRIEISLQNELAGTRAATSAS